MLKKDLQGYVMHALIDDDIFENIEAVKERFPPKERDAHAREQERERVMEEKKLEQERILEEKRLEQEEKKLAAREQERAIEEKKLADREQQRKHEDEMSRQSLRKLDKEEEYKSKLVPGRDKSLVPQFNENDIDGFFTQFEKIATAAQWPRKQWSIMLQTVLTGKAQVTYASVSLEDSSDYDLVKAEILKAYELVPEAYRQHFRGLKKVDGQTHLDFAREKTKSFDKWCRSKDVKDLEGLKQLMLLEEFKWKIQDPIRLYLIEKDVTKLDDAARMADDFALTHKKLLNPPPKQNFRNSQKQNDKTHQSQNESSGEVKENKTGTSASGKTPQGNSKIQCYYCKAFGHIKPNCPKLANKNAQQQKSGGGQSEVKPHGLVTIHESRLCQGDVSDLTGESSQLITGKFGESGLEKTSSCVKGFTSENPFVSTATVSLGESEPVSVKVLRDTGASQTLLLSSTFEGMNVPDAVDFVVCKGIGGTSISVPLCEVHLDSELVKGDVTVGLIPDFPMTGVSLILGNDLAGSKVKSAESSCSVKLTSEPILKQAEDDYETYPACAVTRSMARCQQSEEDIGDVEPPIESGEHGIDLADTIFDQLTDDRKSITLIPELSLGRKQLIEMQEKDDDLVKVRKEIMSEFEIDNVPVGYYLKDGVLMRKYRAPDVMASEEWSVVHQVVVPKLYRNEIMAMAHDLPLSGHLGVRKTKDRILRQFFWPGINKDVQDYCKSCHTCQVVGKYKADPPVAPLQPIPAFGEPFSRVIIDCVGPLPKSKSGNEFLLTVMCASTRFPEAFPLRNIKTNTISKVLLKFFTTFGLPKEIQSDQGSNFTSHKFRQMLAGLGVKQVLASAYHPESQGVLERFHSTLKVMLRTFCLEHQRDWDEGVPLLLFGVREVVQESLGFSPFELVFGHRVRGPLSLLSEQWTDENVKLNLLDYVVKFRERLQETWELAREHLVSKQGHMKTWYDKKARVRVFQPGDKVLVLFPVQSNPLQARFHGPYTVQKRVGDLNYVVETPDRKKRTQLCHVNMLKLYIDRDAEVDPVVQENQNAKADATVNLVISVEDSDLDKSGKVYDTTPIPNLKLSNTEALAKLDDKLQHLEPQQREELKSLLLSYKEVFPDVPGRTTAAVHDVDVGSATPIKQHAYRISPDKVKMSNQEIEYMLEHNIIQRSTSSWSSPCVLVPKPSGSVRFCTDYRKLNSVTKTDVYPIPRIDDCIDRVGDAKYLTKIDLLKGYWCVPLTDRGRELSAFVTSAGLFEYNVMPFGMKNAPATFQRLMEKVLQGLTHSHAYIDDVVIRGDSWEEHIGNIREVLDRLVEANLTVNLNKSEFGCARVSYLGFEIGQGQLAPNDAKVQAIVDYPSPSDRKGVRRFLGMIGYYRKFCRNFAQLALPLTDLLKKDRKFEWTQNCQIAFEKLKEVLCHYPILKMPDFNRDFELAVDASDMAAGGVLLQEDSKNGELKLPVAYFSRKFDKHQRNYSTIEKELLALILAIQHFEVYVNGLKSLKVYTDHNPLVFLKRMKNKNRRLLSWSLSLQEYNLDIEHIRGKDNVIADTLSRR